MVVVSCSDFPETTPHGYAFRFHRQVADSKLEVGDEAYVQFQIRTAEEVLFVSPNGNAGLRTVLQDPALNPIKEPDPIADVLPLMGVGDSVTVMMPVTDDMRSTFGLETADAIYYDIVVRRLGGEEEISTAVEQQAPSVDMEALTGRSRELIDRLSTIPQAEAALNQLLQFVQSRSAETNQSDSLFFELVSEGQTEKLAATDLASVRFIAAREDGSVFAESFSEEPFTFRVGAKQVIEAWEQAATIVGVGGRILLEVPPAVGYGAVGKAPYIGPDDTIYYYFELVENSTE